MQIIKDVSEKKGPNDIKGEDRNTWQTRKEKYLTALKNSNFAAMMVNCADKIHNLKSMVRAYKEQGEKIWRKFNAPPSKELWFFGEVLSILRKNLDDDIVEELECAYRDAKSLFDKRID